MMVGKGKLSFYKFIVKYQLFETESYNQSIMNNEEHVTSAKLLNPFINCCLNSIICV